MPVKHTMALGMSLLFLFACSGETAPSRPDPATAPTGTTAAPEPAVSSDSEGSVTDLADQTIPIQVWFLTEGDRGMPQLYLHHVAVPPARAIGRAALEQLLKGVPPSLTGKAFTIVPKDTKLLGLTIEDGTARVDFTRAFEDTGVGTTVDGSQIAQVVYTLTQFPTVKRVEFLLEGEPVEMLGGHGIVLDGPQSRKDFRSMLPPIVVESPRPGEKVVDRVFLTGISNVFEATVSYRFRSSKTDRILQKGFTTATCGSGCYGKFSQMVPLEFPAQAVTLEVFESSAEDGSPLHIVKLPVNFRRE